ncbi:sensor histidine kinase [Paenibacillus sp. YYML68]|uniref:sensor histidine kinase n=1 Tax=Paenibacillus sp. YYML68 TaxID=2909250 RepID=UPI0024935DA7|nr:sensor histidine kinase [Paenibacillus sp. YYML68]
MVLLLRYSLIVLPAAGTISMLPLSESRPFALYIIMLLAWVELRRSWLPVRAQAIAAVAELCYMSWLSVTVDQLLLLCHLSTLLSYSLEASVAKQHYRLLLLLQLATILVPAYFEQDMRLAIAAAAVFLLAAYLTTRLEQSRHDRLELQYVYDELRHKAYELDAARQRIAAYAAQVERLAQAEERSRIAGDIHDDLGHKLIRAKMMLEAAVAVAPDREHQTYKLTELVRDQLTEALESLRHTVRALKPLETAKSADSLHRHSIHRLIEELKSSEEQQGIKIDLSLSGMPRPLYPSVELILFRNAQEAVTNAIRHGGATQITFTLNYDADQMIMKVANNGRLPAGDTLIRGVGLLGMEERVRLVGGQLKVSLQPQFAVTTVVPLYDGI